MTLADHVRQAKQLMDKAVEAVKREFSTVRTGKATTALLDLVRVDAYGSEMALNQVASVAAPEPKLLTVQPWDKGLLKAIEKAILASELGLTPSNDGHLIRIPLPPLTEERRKELVKHLHRILEAHRTAVRNIRRDIKEAVEKLEKDKKIGEDDRKRTLDELEKLTQNEVKKLEDLSAAKEKEVLTV